MKVLELFAGSRSIGKVADRLTFEVYSSDIEQFGGIDYVVDILDFDVTKIPFKPDIIWASCPCTAFSVAAIGKNWTKVGDDYIPKNPRAEFGLKLVQKTLEIIEHFNPTYFFIENPRGMLRKMPIIADLPRQGVTYCQYGDTRMKPTDIWTNSTKWIPRPMCKNGDPCHVAAPRGSKTGTQGLKGAYERSKIPEELCYEILKSCII
jgi:hypothetical protein